MTALTRPQLWTRRPLVAALALSTILLLPCAAEAQESYNFTASLLAGVGGSTDAEPGNGIDNSAFQLGFSFVTEPRTHLGIRLGRFDLESDEFFGSLRQADLTYLTLGGEYRFREAYYDSGVYLALGGYRLQGTGPTGRSEDETAVGISMGFTGEFEVSRRFGVQLELAGHYADFDDAQLFVTGLVGVAFHFK